MVQQPHDTPSEATAEEGEVMIDGPDGVAASLTPRAAKASAVVIDAAADEAQRQKDETG